MPSCVWKQLGTWHEGSAHVHARGCMRKGKGGKDSAHYTAHGMDQPAQRVVLHGRGSTSAWHGFAWPWTNQHMAWLCMAADQPAHGMVCMAVKQSARAPCPPSDPLLFRCPFKYTSTPLHAAVQLPTSASPRESPVAVAGPWGRRGVERACRDRKGWNKERDPSLGRGGCKRRNGGEGGGRGGASEGQLAVARVRSRRQRLGAGPARQARSAKEAPALLRPRRRWPRGPPARAMGRPAGGWRGGKEGEEYQRTICCTGADDGTLGSTCAAALQLLPRTTVSASASARAAPAEREPRLRTARAAPPAARSRRPPSLRWAPQTRAFNMQACTLTHTPLSGPARQERVDRKARAPHGTASAPTPGARLVRRAATPLLSAVLAAAHGWGLGTKKKKGGPRVHSWEGEANDVRKLRAKPPWPPVADPSREILECMRLTRPTQGAGAPGDACCCGGDVPASCAGRTSPTQSMPCHRSHDAGVPSFFGGCSQMRRRLALRVHTGSPQTPKNLRDGAQQRPPRASRHWRRAEAVARV
eukprot:363804-Chlamydomonas_euryale.AAC.5